MFRTALIALVALLAAAHFVTDGAAYRSRFGVKMQQASLVSSPCVAALTGPSTATWYLKNTSVPLADAPGASPRRAQVTLTCLDIERP